jgi:hypothetical protein
VNRSNTHIVIDISGPKLPREQPKKTDLIENSLSPSEGERATVRGFFIGGLL